jgi:hypothetical protein
MTRRIAERPMANAPIAIAPTATAPIAVAIIATCCKPKRVFGMAHDRNLRGTPGIAIWVSDRPLQSEPDPRGRASSPPRTRLRMWKTGPIRFQVQTCCVAGFTKRGKVGGGRSIGNSVGHIDQGLCCLPDRNIRDHYIGQRVDCRCLLTVLQRDVNSGTIAGRPDTVGEDFLPESWQPTAAVPRRFRNRLPRCPIILEDHPPGRPHSDQVCPCSSISSPRSCASTTTLALVGSRRPKPMQSVPRTKAIRKAEAQSYQANLDLKWE